MNTYAIFGPYGAYLFTTSNLDVVFLWVVTLGCGAVEVVRP